MLQALVDTACRRLDWHPASIDLLCNAVSVLCKSDEAAERYLPALLAALHNARPVDLDGACLMHLTLEALAHGDLVQVAMLLLRPDLPKWA